MYSIDREKASKLLNISTRTLDRYIKSGKIRSQKKGKKVFLHSQDIEIIKSGGIQEDYEVLKPKEFTGTGFEIKPLSHATKDIKVLYEESLRQIEKKDDIIRDLSYRLGKAEVELKNSIPLLEYKKTTFLLEASTSKQEEDKKDLIENIEKLKDKVRNGEFLNLVLVIIFTILLVVIFLVWFANV